MMAMSKRHSSSQQASMPRYGNIPTGASPARRLGERVRAGRKADLNSSQREDHSTSRRGGSGHWRALSGMVATSAIHRTTILGDWYLVVCQKEESYFRLTSVFLVFFISRCSGVRSEEHTSELQSLRHLVCR